VVEFLPSKPRVQNPVPPKTRRGLFVFKGKLIIDDYLIV
jgi:hypothetical protein